MKNKQSNLMKNETKESEFLNQPWQKMNMSTQTKINKYVENITQTFSDHLQNEELIKVSWLSLILFFIVGGYWLLRSLKDPIISSINGVSYIPQAKMASLLVVFAFVIICKYYLQILTHSFNHCFIHILLILIPALLIYSFIYSFLLSIIHSRFICIILSYIYLSNVGIDNKLLDIFPKHQVFYILGVFYGAVFFVIGLLLMHPTIGLPNTTADPYRVIG